MCDDSGGSSLRVGGRQLTSRRQESQEKAKCMSGQRGCLPLLTSSESPETEEGLKPRREEGLVTEWEVAGCARPWQSKRIHQVPSRKKGLQGQLSPRAQTLSPRLGHSEQRHLLRGADGFFLKNVKVKESKIGD